MAKRRGNGEGSVYQRKDGLWVAEITLVGRKRRYIYGKTRKEVQERLKIALREQQQGTLITTPRQTVEQFLKYWLEVRNLSVRIRINERYEQFVRLHIIPAIGSLQLQKLTPQHI